MWLDWLTAIRNSDLGILYAYTQNLLPRRPGRRWLGRGWARAVIAAALAGRGGWAGPRLILGRNALRPSRSPAGRAFRRPCGSMGGAGRIEPGMGHFAATPARLEDPCAIPRLVLAIFILSGAAGLMYEVVWSRQLVLVFGNTTQAVSTILTGFFGGLAIGSFVGGRLADRVRNAAPAVRR